MHPSSDRPYLGISSGLFPNTEAFIQDFSLMHRHGFSAVEVGYEQTGPALGDKKQ